MEFWFEFASPYSYLAAMRIGNLARTAGVEITWRPFLLGPIFAARGWSTSPFELFPDKGRYAWRDVEREAAVQRIPFRRPSRFPAHTVLAARLALIAARDGLIEAFAREVFSAQFARDEDIASERILDAILARIGISDGPSFRARAVADDNRENLRKQVEQATALGIFGAPSFAVDGELFWGNDRLERALDWARASSDR